MQLRTRLRTGEAGGGTYIPQGDYIMEALKSTLRKYDKCQLECDGLTRVLHTVLVRLNYSHTVMVGSITLGLMRFSPHFWIELPDGRIVDYRARMWLGRKAQHGIFKQSLVVYAGEPIEWEPLSDALFNILTKGA